MSESAPQAQSTVPAPATRSPGLWDVMLSEYLKIVSVRSFRWILLSTPVITAIISLVCGTTLPQTTGKSLSDYPPANQLAAFLYGAYAVTIVMFVFAALVVSSEYSTKGAITTAIITPRRGRVFVAKVAVIAVLSWAVGLLAVAICVAIGTAATGGELDVVGNGLVRNAFWFSLQPVFYSVFAALVVLIHRSLGWGISATVGVFAVIPLLLRAMPTAVDAALKPFTPVAALHSIAGTPVPGSTEDIGALGGVAVLVGWIAVFSLLAWRRFSRTDV